MDRVVRILLCGLLCAAAGCSKGYDPEPPAAFDVPEPNITIARLHDLCPDEAVVVREPLAITGLVTTSDREGNFYRTLCIEQEGAAVELLTGTEESCNRYPVGCRLVLRLQGLCMERSRGVLQIGVPAASSAWRAADYFYSQALLDEYLFRKEPEAAPSGRILAAGELTQELCGTLVLIPGLRYRPLPEEETDAEAAEAAETGAEDAEEPCWEGYRRFEDDEGFALHTYVSSYARFAGRRVPTGRTALRGILQYVDSGEYAGYVLKLRDENDCLD